MAKFPLLYVTIFFTISLTTFCPAEEADREKLQGRWKLVSATIDGKSSSEEIGRIIIIG
jgi:hypothetical protein